MALNLNALSMQCHINHINSRPPVCKIRSKVFMATTPPANSMVLDNLKAPPTPEVIHSMPPEKAEIFKSLEGWTRNNILVHLKSVEESWQPQNYLPNPVSEGFEEQVLELRERAKEIPDEYFVVLVGDMITEEALPTYMSYNNTLDGTKDDTGADTTAWATWTRGWTAEENRHGDLMNKYLYLSGRVDMNQIEKTIQYLIGAGMDIKTEKDPYKAFIFASFQEKATFISHANTAKLAQHYGDKNLAQICGNIASDEKRHATAYTKMVQKLAEVDPDTTVISFANMMRKKIQMPGHSMYDGSDNLLFKHFASVSQKIGVYSAEDYCDILEFLVKKWNIERLTGLSDEGRKSQEYVCDLANKIRRIEKIKRNKEKKGDEPVTFSWIFNRELMI